MNKRASTIFFVILFAVFFSVRSEGADYKVTEGEALFIAELPTPSEFTLFANGGWSGNWYVGHNHGWISSLPSVDTGGAEKVFLGARLGRAKTIEQIKEVFVKENKDLKDGGFTGSYPILIGVSDSKEKKPVGRVLVTTDRIPLEGSSVMALDGVTESRWFWVEIDKNELSPEHDNYIHLWSDSEQLSSEAVAPILAGGLGSNTRVNSYLVQGDDIKVIKFFEPAIAIKLVGPAGPVPEIEIVNFGPHPVDPAKYVLKTRVKGENITKVGVELDKGEGWKRVGNVVANPPYDLVFGFKDLELGKYKIRCWARNWWEKISYSNTKTFLIE